MSARDKPRRPWSRSWLLPVLFVLLAGGSPLLLAQSVTVFPLPDPAGAPRDITAGPDGNLWFTESQSDRVGRITTTGIITEFPLPSGSFPGGITAGPDGNLWFCENGRNRIGKITPSGTLVELAIPNAYPAGGPGWITTGPDENLWFTETDGGLHGRVSRLTVSGQFTQFPLPSTSGNPHEIVVGADGNLWFSMPSSGEIGRITVSGVLSEVSTPPPSGLPIPMAAGTDGNVWFAEVPSSGAGGFRVGKVDPSGSITVFPVDAAVAGIAGGPGGNLWFTSDGSLGRVTPAGRIASVPLPEGSDPGGIVQGPDDALWLTQPEARRILRYSVFPDCALDAIGQCARLVPQPVHRARPGARDLP